ncbi:hypothetical protein ILYODFUR_030085 [Ilyodon furcidens]|uniref:Secreted protein n=1 Tax=Ilyodon furcidens TaxID=33524 RepID=A0ABV0TCH9_9TELE
MRVGMCVCNCVRLFFVSGWVLGCSLSWISLDFPSNVGPIPSPPHYLPVVYVSARWCTCGPRYPGLGALLCSGSLTVAVCWGLDPWALTGLCLGSDKSRGLGSLDPWLDLLRRRRLPAGPVGSLLHLPGLLHYGRWVVLLGIISVSVSVTTKITPKQCLIMCLLMNIKQRFKGSSVMLHL